MPQTDQSGAPERTRLAWRRTSLAATVVTILLLRLALLHHSPRLAITVSALAALGWVLLLVLIHRRVRTLPTTLTSATIPVLTALACLGLAALGILASCS